MCLKKILLFGLGVLVALSSLQAQAVSYQSQALSVKDLGLKSQALAVINASFFNERLKPLGLILQDGKIEQDQKKVSWWATLLWNDSQLKIIKTFSKQDLQGYQNGIQAGPRLVINGYAPRLKTEISPKSALGIDPQGRLILIASEGSVEINTLANFLALPSSKGGMGLRQALNLDGGSSTQFYLKTQGLTLDLPGIAKVPVGLGIFPLLPKPL